MQCWQQEPAAVHVGGETADQETESQQLGEPAQQGFHFCTKHHSTQLKDYENPKFKFEVLKVKQAGATMDRRIKEARVILINKR